MVLSLPTLMDRRAGRSNLRPRLFEPRRRSSVRHAVAVRLCRPAVRWGFGPSLLHESFKSRGVFAPGLHRAGSMIHAVVVRRRAGRHGHSLLPRFEVPPVAGPPCQDHKFANSGVLRGKRLGVDISVRYRPVVDARPNVRTLTVGRFRSPPMILLREMALSCYFVWQKRDVVIVAISCCSAIENPLTALRWPAYSGDKWQKVGQSGAQPLRLMDFEGGKARPV